jgi:predicted dienelactone hydrolase
MYKMIGCLLIMSSALGAQINHINAIRHDAPELAHYGAFAIGVRTLTFTNSDQPDILNTTNGEETTRYDRELVVEMWYPAQLTEGQLPGGEYKVMSRDPRITATLRGSAVRDATTLRTDAKFPLVVISHGYPGNRYLMGHLGENLASKGYVVVSIDHKDSTYDDMQAFASTLYNRPVDQRFVIDRMAALTAEPTSFLEGIVDVGNTAVIGYSMGGYGLVNNLGGGFSDASVASPRGVPNGLLAPLAASSPDYRSQLGTRIKAGVAIAPWGMTHGVWRPEDLHGIQVPALYVSGSLDKTAGYEEGTRAIYENSVNSDRYLLTFVNAGHNAAAPMPVPQEILNSENKAPAGHYIDPVWDTLRMNNILAHFVTAFLDRHLKGDDQMSSYLDLVPHSKDAVYSLNKDQPKPDHTYWKGFPKGTAQGLIFEHMPPRR